MSNMNNPRDGKYTYKGVVTVDLYISETVMADNKSEAIRKLKNGIYNDSDGLGESSAKKVENVKRVKDKWGDING